MAQITIEIDNSLAAKFDHLKRFFGSKDIMFGKFIEFHRKNTEREIARMQVDLQAFEKEYSMDSASFFSDFENGLLDDKEDYILWSGIYEMQLNSKKASLNCYDFRLLFSFKGYNSQIRPYRI